MNKNQTFANATPRYSTAYKVDESKVLQPPVKPNQSNLQFKQSASINMNIKGTKSNDTMVNNKLNDGRLETKEHYFNPFPKSSRNPTDEELDYILNNDLPLVEEPKDERKDKSKPKKRINIIKSKQDNDINNINDNINIKSQFKNSSNIHLGRKKKKNLDDINKYDIQLDQTTASLTSSTDSSKPTAIVNIKYIPLAKKLVKENSDFKGYEHANTAYDYKLPDFEYSKQYITAKWNRMQHCQKQMSIHYQKL